LYSRVRHIARAVRHDEYRSVPIVMFTAYFDASGNKRSPVLTMAGFVSRVSKWDRFEREWPKLLKSYGVSSLHMTEFVSAKGQFEGWKGDSARRKKFIDDVVACVKRNTNKGVATSVIISEFNEVNSTFCLAEEVGTPYTMCGMMAIAMVRDWAIKKGIDPKRVLYMIEDGDEDQGKLIERANKDGYKVIPLAKTEAQAFQAGDLAAWKAMAALREAERKTKLRVNQRLTIDDLASIVRSLDTIAPILNQNGVLSIKRLRLMCADHRIKPR
jgi:hypothetical protein